jgi:hypothetical protein
MYQDNLAYSAGGQQTIADPSKPQLVYINDDLRNEIVRYQDLANLVQERLHNILNLREPEKPMGNSSTQSMPSSFVDQMKENITALANCNIKLSKALEHLNKIV